MVLERSSDYMKHTCILCVLKLVNSDVIIHVVNIEGLHSNASGNLGVIKLRN